MKDLIDKLLNTLKPHRVCYALFKALNSLESPKFNPNVFGTLIIAFSEMGLVEEASWVYHKIGILPVVPVCNALLNGLVKKGMFESMWQFHTDMLSRGMVSNFVTYGVLIDGCCGLVVNVMF